MTNADLLFELNAKDEEMKRAEDAGRYCCGACSEALGQEEVNPEYVAKLQAEMAP